MKACLGSDSGGGCSRDFELQEGLEESALADIPKKRGANRGKYNYTGSYVSQTICKTRN